MDLVVTLPVVSYLSEDLFRIILTHLGDLRVKVMDQHLIVLEANLYSGKLRCPATALIS